jgi:hypothetical protein
VAGCINQVEDIFLSVSRMDIPHLDSVALDGDTSLALQIHIVRGLILHLAFADGVRIFQQPVGERTLAVVNVSDNAKIANVLHALGWMNGV